jgi:hypothetical protein
VDQNPHDRVSETAAWQLRSVAYALASPELRSKMDEEDRRGKSVERVRFEAKKRQSAVDSINRSLAHVALAIIAMLVVFAAMYGAIKFVKWAWFN